MELRKEDIENLFVQYGIETHKFFIDELCNKVNGFVSEILQGDYDNSMLEVAETLYFLRGLSGEIEVKGTIKEPRNTEKKNQTRKAKLNISAIKDDLEANLSKILRTQEPILSFTATAKAQHINITEKIEEGFFKGDEFTESPLSNEELEYIIERGRKDKEEVRREPKNMNIGNLCQIIMYDLQANCNFNDNGFKLNSIKGYSLIYDIITLSGHCDKIIGEKQFSGLVGKEKYTWVKNKITAYFKSPKAVSRHDWISKIIG